MKKIKTKVSEWYENNIDTLIVIEKTIMSDKIWHWIWVLVVIWMLLILNTEPTESSTTYSNHICDTNKCNARIERLNECKWDIECTVNLTIEASYDYLYSDIANLKKKSLEPKKMGINNAVSFIANFEWMRLEAYYDWYANNSNRWSIWYGTKSFKWEIITKEEAIKRKMAVITPIYESIPSCFNENQKIALTSYMYNTWGFQMNLKYHVSECRNKDVEYIMSVYWWNDVLIKRRNAEILKYNS